MCGVVDYDGDDGVGGGLAVVDCGYCIVCLLLDIVVVLCMVWLLFVVSLLVLF